MAGSQVWTQGLKKAAWEIAWKMQGRFVMNFAMDASRIRIPSEEACRQLVAQMGMMDHIVAHSLQVCRVSLLMVDRLPLPGLNRELVRAAAHLHDITKTRSFETREDHAETGARLLTDLGYPEVGYVIGQHVRLDRYFVSDIPSEAEIVNYADKRVLHDRVEPLGERMGYILERYGNSPERKRSILKLWKKTEELEERLFGYLPFSPQELGCLIGTLSPSRGMKASKDGA